MALDDAVVRELLKKLEADREAYLATVTKTHEILAKALSGSRSTPAVLETVPEAGPLESTSPLPDTTHEPIRKFGVPESLGQSSTFSAEDDEDTDGDEFLYVQDTLPSESYSEDQLRDHLKTHDWTEHGRTILGHLLRDQEFLNQTSLFPLDSGPVADRSHLSHHNAYTIGTDGTPLPHRPSANTPKISKSLAIWESLNVTNSNPQKRQAVGKITIVREPSPLLFGAIHLTMNQHFDMDEMFRLLVDSSPTKAYMSRAFLPEPKQQRTFVFCLKYFTIIGDDCQPKVWQQSDAELKGSSSHIPITRCCSTIALSLSGEPTCTVKNKARRAKTEVGNVYDAFSPWRVLSVQCFPDWKSTMDSHDSTKHYVNGPEAFLVTLLAEYRDAQKRFMEIHRRIVALATPPIDFMFNEKTRDDLLFEDDRYTYSRRYFWCFQTLAIMSDNVQALIDAYRETFTEDVWTGRHKTIWPGPAVISSRYAHWRRRMALLRKEFEREVGQLEQILWLNYREQKDIQALRDHLFSGTSVLESRKSVEQASITVQQGHNIKLLTLVTIFFLPLTFVTSIFGMTNMNPKDSFVPFGIVTVIICLPTYMLIGSLNTTRGLKFWTEKTRSLGHYLANGFAILLRTKKRVSRMSEGTGSESTEDDVDHKPHFDRSHSTQANMAVRYGKAESHPGAASTPPIKITKPARDADEHRPTPTAITFHQMTYDRRQSEARRVSVSNIGPLSEPMGPENQLGRRSFLQTLSEWNQQRRLDHVSHEV